MRVQIWTLLTLAGALWGVSCSDGDDKSAAITKSQSREIWSATYQALTQVEGQLLPDMDQKDRGTGKGDALNDGGSDTKDSGPDALDGGHPDTKDGGPEAGLDTKDGGDGGGGWISGTINSFQVSGTVQNSAGAGSATITGTGGKSGTTWGVALTLTFNGWGTATGIVISGPLELDYSLTSLVPAEMTLSVKGTLQAKVGPLTLPAAVNVKVEVKGGATTTCGTVAGNPVGSGPCS